MTAQTLKRKQKVKLPSVQPSSSKLRLQLLPILTLTHSFDLDKIWAVREVSTAAINLSGRQRMLSQRAALYALRLVNERDPKKQKYLRQELLEIVNLIEESHQGLIEGNSALKLSGYLSPALQKIYYEPPYNLHQQICHYIQAGKALAQAFEAELTVENSNLQYLLAASDREILEALDAAVSQYQQEKEEQEFGIDCNRAQLYQDSRTATAVAQSRSQELSEALTELQNTQVQLIQAEKLSGLGQLVAGVAHEVNNPLGFISGNIDYAKNYAADLVMMLQLYQQYYPEPPREIRDMVEEFEIDYICEDLPKLLHSMKMGTDRIAEIVLSLRNFSRTGLTQAQPVDLHQGIDSTLVILQYRFKHSCHNTRIQVIKEYGELPPVECYPGQLNQAFMNLISNAIDALEEGSAIANPQICIRTELVGEDRVAVRIADNGPGIPEEVQQKLFQPFYTTKPVDKGTGLGLSISHQIVVERHGGTLSCRSQPGNGTEFAIEIPIQQTFG